MDAASSADRVILFDPANRGRNEPSGPNPIAVDE